MVCRKCGAEIKEGGRFCAKCGTPVEEVKAAVVNTEMPGDEGKTETKAQSEPASRPDGSKLPVVPLAVGAAIVILAAVIGGFFLFRGKNDSEPADAAVSANTNTAANGNDGDTSAGWRELTPLYVINDVPSVNIHAQNYTVAAKAPGIAWDSTLFYWLEDVDPTSSEDGYLARCFISKMLLRNAESENIIQYEIYRDPNSDEIYKIVSIEQEGEELRLVDYYYQGGVPNFTFSRSDSVYTPIYATPAKVGERYYFNGDVMARWRMIREPNVIGEYVLAPNGASYSQADYYTESAELQAIYDDTELRELNAARNTFDAVTAAGNGIGMVEGRVTDTAGNPVAGVTVDILRAEDGVLLYRAVTEEDGSFNIFVYLEDVECSIVLRENGVYDSNSVQGVLLARSNGGSSCGNLVMHRLDGDEYPVHINVYSAAEVRTGEDGSLLRDLLPGAEVSLRAGAGARTGEVLQTLEADGDGRVNATLRAGTYTAQVDVPGYTTAYLTIEVAEQETTAEGYVLPTLAADQAGIVMTWEGEADLDLTLFTPYQSTDGDMAHIGGRITEDGYGNRLIADNAAGCEVMYVNTAVPGNYKLYVNNYTESEAGNYSSGQLSTLNIHIYIYDSNGLLAEYSFPAGQTGVVWEVADLNGGRVTSSQRVYASLEGKNWWTESKWVLDLEENVHLRNLMESMVEAAWGNNGYHSYGNDRNAANGMQVWAEELYQGNWEMIGGWLATLAVAYYDYPKSANSDRVDIPYIDEIMTQPDVAQILNDRGGSEGGWLLTKDQLEYLAYAASGHRWEMQSIDEVMNAHGISTETFTERVGDSVIFGENAAGSMTGIYLQNLSTEYIGGGNWRITADCIYVSDFSNEISDIQFADITFIVTRNPDSCFDGYSITGMSVIPTDNSGWAQAYYDYLTGGNIYSDYLGSYDYSYFIESAEYLDYKLCFVDEDNIPELLVSNGLYYIHFIHTIKNGKIVENWLGGGGWSDLSIIEKSNKAAMITGGSAFGAVYYEVYEMSDGLFQEIADGVVYLNPDVFWNDGYEVPPNEWNGKEVSEEEFYASLNEIFDTSTAQTFAYYECFDYETMLSVLQQIINQ